jgi:hypothetical protein
MDARINPAQRLRAAVDWLRQGHKEAITALDEIASETSAPTWIREEARSHIYRHRWRLQQHHPSEAGLLRAAGAFTIGALMRVLQRLQLWQFFLMQASESSGTGGGSSRQAATQALVAANRTGELLALLSNPETDWGKVELVRPVAAKALAETCASSDLAALASDTAAASEGRIQAAWALALRGNSDELKSALLAIVRDRSVDDPFQRRPVAAELLRALEDTETLVAILRDESLDTRMRVWSAEASLKLGLVDDVTQVARSIKTEVWTRVRLAERLG